MTTNYIAPAGRQRVELILDALKVAINHYEYENDLAKAKDLQTIFDDMDLYYFVQTANEKGTN